MKKITFLLGSLMIAALSIPVFVMAVPPGDPPAGLVTPFFNGIQIGAAVGTPRLEIDQLGGISNHDPSIQSGYVHVNDNFKVTGNAEISSNLTAGNLTTTGTLEANTLNVTHRGNINVYLASSAGPNCDGYAILAGTPSISCSSDVRGGSDPHAHRVLGASTTDATLNLAHNHWITCNLNGVTIRYVCLGPAN